MLSNRQTDILNYHNPRCACAARVNHKIVTATVSRKVRMLYSKTLYHSCYMYIEYTILNALSWQLKSSKNSSRTLEKDKNTVNTGCRPSSVKIYIGANQYYLTALGNTYLSAKFKTIQCKPLAKLCTTQVISYTFLCLYTVQKGRVWPT